MFLKSALPLSLLALMLVGCSGITAQPDNNSAAPHRGQVYHTDRISLELVPTLEGLKIFPSVPVKEIKVLDAFYSYVVEKSNHSLRLIKKKDYILAEGDFAHDKSYRLHMLLQHHGLDEDVTLNFKY